MDISAGSVAERHNRTYYAVNPTLAYAGYATPTDMFAIRNPVDSDSIVVPRVLSMLAQSTAAALMKFSWYRRNALNTGGTPTDLAPVLYDSNGVPARAVPRVYGSAPNIVDGAAPIINLQWASTTTLATAPTNFNTSGGSFGWALNAIDYASPLLLYPGQELVMNLAGAALPAGFTAICQATWMEYPLPH